MPDDPPTKSHSFRRYFIAGLITVIPLWAAGGLVKVVRLLSKQFGDLAEFIVVAGEVDGVGPPLGTTTLRSYFERLAAEDPNA